MDTERICLSLRNEKARNINHKTVQKFYVTWI